MIVLFENKQQKIQLRKKTTTDREGRGKYKSAACIIIDLSSWKFLLHQQIYNCFTITPLEKHLFIAKTHNSRIF